MISKFIFVLYSITFNNVNELAKFDTESNCLKTKQEFISINKNIKYKCIKQLKK